MNFSLVSQKKNRRFIDFESTLNDATLSKICKGGVSQACWDRQDGRVRAFLAQLRQGGRHRVVSTDQNKACTHTRSKERGAGKWGLLIGQWLRDVIYYAFTTEHFHFHGKFLKSAFCMRSRNVSR